MIYQILNNFMSYEIYPVLELKTNLLTWKGYHQLSNDYYIYSFYWIIYLFGRNNNPKLYDNHIIFLIFCS